LAEVLWLANNLSIGNDLQGREDQESRLMPTLVLSLFRFAATPLQWSWRAVAMENTALRVQLVAFQRKRKRPILTCVDRLFWVSLLWTGWRAPLVYVRADPVVRWQRERFRRFWARRSKVNQRDRGRPTTAVEIPRLIERMVAANPLWGAPRIHGELKILGIEISERTFSRILRRLPRPPGQTCEDVPAQSPRSDGFD
jgi:hypothetical protein